ncbi:MAG TPA: hypothetical protein VGD99_20620, partial [Anaerolineae bacterium]
MLTPAKKLFANQDESFLNRLAGYFTNGSFDLVRRDNRPAKADQTRQEQSRVDLKVMSIQEGEPVAILNLHETLDVRCYSELMAL